MSREKKPVDIILTMPNHSFNLQHHLQEKHNVSPFSTYLKEIVYGGTDGIVTTFAVVAGFTGAQHNAIQLPAMTVLLFGFANLFADAASMGLGSFLSTRSEQDLYKEEQQKELHEIRTNPADEVVESKAILIAKGFTEEQAAQLVEIYKTNEPYWLNFMMTQELEMADPTHDKPMYMAVATFLSFIFFGFIPLIPYLIFAQVPAIFAYSCLATAIALSILGFLRWKVTQQSFVRSMTETILLGGTSALVAYIVGTFFKL